MNLLLFVNGECKYLSNHIYQVTLQSSDLSAHQKGHALRRVSPLQVREFASDAACEKSARDFW